MQVIDAISSELKKRLLWLLNNYPSCFFRLGLKSLKLWGEEQERQKLYEELKLTNQQRNDFENPNLGSLETIYQWLSPTRQIIWYPDLPGGLKQIFNPPVLIFLEGERTLLDTLQLAMVGTRKPSLMGLAIAEKFAEIFTNHGLTVISGLATGIDAASHRGALRNRATIAVMGTGMLNTYPRFHKKLREDILAYSGLIISEFPLQASAHGWHFPLRNRLISGLSQGVLVVEAGLRSGSLITARLAAEQGKEVFAIPGSIYHPESQGCLYLLSQGAKLVTKPEDVLENFSLVPKVSPAANLQFSSADQKIVWTVLDEPLSLEEIVQRTGFSPSKVQLIILELLNDEKITKGQNSYFRVL